MYSDCILHPLDIRQESSVHDKVLEAIAEKEDILPERLCEIKRMMKRSSLLTDIAAKANHGFI